MLKKYSIILFYSIFIVLGSLSLVFIPNALSHSYGSIAALFILSAPLFYFSYSKFGAKKSLLLFLSLSAFALCVEYMGLVTTWPYGSFTYTGHLGYKLFGVLPWTVGLSWPPLVIGSVALSYTATENKIARILLPVALLVAFDALLDPLSVHFGIWAYAAGGAYYGVPVQNFIGWVFSGLIGSLICFFYLNAYPKNMYPLAYSLLINICFWTIIALLIGFVTPSVFGLCLIVFGVGISFRKI